MTSIVILGMFLSYPFLRCHSSETKRNTDDITATCFEPLGISDGRIKDDQLISLSAFDNDFKTYGPHRARLNMTSWPPGYRCAHEKANSAWLRVDIGYMVMITGIATQGYGDLSVSEWLTGYILLYSQGTDYAFFREGNGEIQMFLGNQDRNSIQLNQVALPAKALNVMLMSTSWHNNFAFRMELYGCKPAPTPVNNTTTSPPVPRIPSEEERSHSVKLEIQGLNVSQWNQSLEEAFKTAMAIAVTEHCPKEQDCYSNFISTRRRRAAVVFTKQQVHILPGYPKQMSEDPLLASLAFYLQFPPGSSSTVVKRDTLVSIVKRFLRDISSSINLNITNVQTVRAVTIPTAAATSGPTEKEETNTILYIVAGCVAGGVVLIIIAVLIAW